MSAAWGIWLVTGIYLVQAGEFAWRGLWPQAAMLLGYAIANLGLIWSVRG